jgi:hypothetical protein
MLPETYAALSPQEKKEVDGFCKQFIAAVKKTGLNDGWEFAQRYQIRADADGYVLAAGESVLPGIRTRSKKSLKALLENATMNYGR